MSCFSHFDPSDLLRSSSTRLWHLPRDTTKSWKLFEKSIHLALEALESYFTTNYPDIPVIWEAPAKPSKYGFFDGHATREEATEAIFDSIDGFVVYTAYFSFLIALKRWLLDYSEQTQKSNQNPHTHKINQKSSLLQKPQNQ